MENFGAKMIIIEYERKIEFLEKKVSNLEMINVRLSEMLSNVKFEKFIMDSLVAEKEREIRVLKEELEQTLAKIPQIEPDLVEPKFVELKFSEPNLVEPNLGEPNLFEQYLAESNPAFDDIPLDKILLDPFQCTITTKQNDNELTAVPSVARVDSPMNYLEIFESRKIEIPRDANGYQCDQCDYKSSSTKSFKEHYNTHTREESFGCKLCKQRFKTKSTCYRHIRTHDRFKIKCSSCDYTATRSEYVIKHAKKAHNDNKTKSFNLFKPTQAYPNLFKRTHDQIE